MGSEWEAKDLETLDFRERLGGIGRNQLQHCGLYISADELIHRIGVRHRKPGIRRARSRQCRADVIFDTRLNRADRDIRSLKRGC